MWIQFAVFSLRRSKEFDVWLRALSDLQGKAKILARLTRAERGNLGDCKPIGEGVSEMRIQAGPGYRIYFVHQGKSVYLLLVGGDNLRSGTSRGRRPWPVN